MKIIYVAFLAVLLCFFVSCTKDQPPPDIQPPAESQDVQQVTPEPEPELEPESEPEPEPEAQPEQQPEPEQKFFSCLTGLEISEQESLNRPIAVMINNSARSLPQSGVAAADIIFECEVEGGETRMLALYKSYENLGVIGSIRSSRDYFIDFVQIFDAIYVHAGGSPQAYVHLKERKINNLDGVNMYLPDCFWRDSERRATSAYEHTLVTSGKKISAEIENNFGYRTILSTNYEPSFTFADEQYTPSGEDASYLKIPRVFPSEFNFDSQSALYTHTQHARVQSDRETGEQLTFKNILVLFCPQKILGDEKNRISVDFTGDGKGYFLTMGKYIPVTWHRDGRDSGVSVVDREGTPIKLNPGKTFVSIVNSYYSKSLTFK